VLSADGKKLVVIGVVPDNHTNYTNEADGPTLYTLRTKPVRGDMLLVRFHGEVGTVAAALKRIVHDLDPHVLVLPSTLRAQMDENAEVGWLIGKMLLFVALVAAGLALLGIYGVVGYSVTRRTREFGIRTALGAMPRDVMRLVFTSGVRPVIAGIAVGIVCAFVFSSATVKALQNAPLPLRPTSPTPYGAVAMSLVVAALVAMIGHARRAARIDPLVALREE
jgi:putative ABC transport system permease protein